MDHLLGSPVFVHYYSEKFPGNREDMVVVSPDVGSVTRARTFAQRMGMQLAIVDKRRPPRQHQRGHEHHRRRAG